MRRNFLPLSLLRRRFGPDGHTGPPPKITGFPVGSYQAEDPAAGPTLRTGTSPFLPMTPRSPAPGPGEAATPPSAGVFPEPAPASTGPSAPGVPGTSGPGTDAAPAEQGSGPEAPVTEPSPVGWAALPPPAAPPGNGAVRAPAPSSPGGKRERSGRRYRFAGLLAAVIVLIAAAVMALLLSCGSGAAGNDHG
ncbi:MAG: hypothetical protein ACTHPS_06590, partial [Streptosporangiaceae bacterium]